MKKALLFRLAVLVAAMMCALGAAAVEAYACYTPSNTTLTFYYDNQRSSRTGTTYDLNTGNYSPGWYTDGTYSNVSEVKFDPSFANARPTTCHSWFRDMAQLQTIYGLNYMNTSAVTHMVSMFRGCSSLTVLDLSSFSTANVIAMGGMFMGCSNLRTIYAGSGWSTAAVEASAGMFSSCTSLVGGQGTTFNSSHVGIDYAHIDGGPSNPGYFTAKTEAYACYTPSNTTLTFYYDSQRSSRTGTTYDLNTGDNITGWESDGTNANVTKVVFDSSFAGARPTTTSGWFYDMTNLQSITGMSYLNTSEVTNMSWMFYNCTKLTSLDVSHFNTSNVTDMNQMFCYCTGLTNLDLSNFNTSKVTDMGAMFRNCTRLTSLDVSHFNTSKVAYMTNMFDGCSNLQTITVGSDWSTAAVTSSTNMFNNCTSLVGGQGTTWNDSNPKDKTYAHIDGGTSNPGYFTEKGPETYADVAINATNFPDAAFRNYLMSEYPSGTITTAQLNARTELILEHKGISNMTGVQYFTQLKKLSLYDNNLTSINVRALTKLTYLNLGNNKLTSINVDNNTALEQLYLQSNQLTSVTVEFLSDLRTLWVSRNPNLTNLECACNDLSNFDIYNCTALQNLSCFNNPHLSTIYNLESCTALTHLDCEDCAITELPGVANMTNLQTLWACNNQLTSLNVSNLSQLKKLNVSGNTSLTELDCSECNLTLLDVTGCTALSFLNCNYNQLTDLDISGCTGLEDIWCRNNQLTSLDLSPCNNLYTLDCRYNQISSLDIAHHTNLEELWCQYNNLTSLDVSGCTSLELISANSNQIASMNVSNCPNLQTMSIYYNRLTGNAMGNLIAGLPTRSGNTGKAYVFVDPNPDSGSTDEGNVITAALINQASAKHWDLYHYNWSNSSWVPYTGSSTMRGDVNGDGSVNISDVTALIDLLLGGGTISNPAADCNQDSSVNISDVTSLIDYLLSGRW